MIRRMLALAMTLLLLTTGSAGAAGVLAGSGVADHYDTGMACFYLEQYQSAVQHFRSAGNYQDAKKWAYYCEAIHMVMTASGSQALEQAQARFELLAAQHFEQAAQWASYCKARSYEQLQMKAQARELYAAILVHDSIERCLACSGRTSLLESADAVRRRRGNASLPASDLYETGMNYYFLENYATAADYFCLAGNYSDARQWRCFCTAVGLVTANGSISDAQILFDLLEAQGFAAAKDWVVYCRAREYESMRLHSNAISLYKTIFVHDSSERYLQLSNK